MALQMSSGTFLTGKEAASLLVMSYQSFANKRTELGDDFIEAHRIIPGRVFFKIEDVERVRRQREGGR